MAAVCVLATVDEDGRPEARTLVLRQVEDDLALFMHTSSPKWQQLQHGGSINTYWPSVEIQYRMHYLQEHFYMFLQALNHDQVSTILEVAHIPYLYCILMHRCIFFFPNLRPAFFFFSNDLK